MAVFNVPKLASIIPKHGNCWRLYPGTLVFVQNQRSDRSSSGTAAIYGAAYTSTTDLDRIILEEHTNTVRT